MKILIVILLIGSQLRAQTLKVKLRPQSFYYTDSIFHEGHGIPDLNYTYLLIEPIHAQGCFKALLYNKMVYVSLRDIISTPAYRKYFEKYFFLPLLKNTTKWKPN